MALLNKLFFPSANTSSSALAANGSGASSSGDSPLTVSGISVSSGVDRSRRQQNNNQPVHSKNYLSQFPFDGRQVRVLLYRECDRSGRKLLFDSNTLQKVPLKEANGNLGKTERFTIHRHGNCNTNSKHQAFKRHSSTSFIEVCDEYGYKHTQPNSADFTSIGEMVFGALAMSFRGTSFKVHWLPEPLRILCSQVFLTPVGSANGQSPYSTISMNSLATPRTSISSEHGSIDGFSISSYTTLPFSPSGNRQLSLTPSDRGSYPLDVPDQQSLSAANSDSGRTDSGPRYSSTYSNATDSGYDGMSRSQLSSDQWSASYQYSTRSSLGSVTSDHMDALHKLSVDAAAYFPLSAVLDDTVGDGSLQRRISRNLRTSFENEHAMNDLIGFVSDNLPGGGPASNGGGSEGGGLGVPNYRRASYCANESRSNPEMGRRRDAGGGKPMPRRAKLGLAVCIAMSESFEEEMEVFCSEHIALLESMLGRLRASTERAYINHKDFHKIMVHAWQDTQQWFSDLFTAPRIKCPIWLSITTSGNKYSKSVAEKFMKELCWLLSLADTKDTNFFISTMLTAILTHHLGWVSTVAAFNSSSARADTSAAAIERRAKLLQVSQKHPYNALWAQMGDLYGAIGVPPKLARTVIYGTEKLAVERLLNILTYFIRCGEVRRSAKREDFNKEVVGALVCQRKNDILKKSVPNSSGVHLSRFHTGLRKGSAAGLGASNSSGGVGGLMRTQTCKHNLNTISDGGELPDKGIGGEDEDEGAEEPDNAQLMRTLRTLKKNEIPNVLAFRDSRFVQQELRIGNYLMDTGIEKKSLLKHASAATDKDVPIRVLITTPDNEQVSVEDESSVGGSNATDDGAMEAIEIEASETSAAQAGVVHSAKRNFFWQVVKEGVSMSDLQHKAKLGQGLDTALQSQLQHLPQGMSHLSLSDLITQNSMGKSDRMTWGIEPRRDTVSLEEEIHFDACQKLINRGHGNAVVFMLGDNEPLVNLKKSNEDLTALPETAKPVGGGGQSLCSLHQRTHGATLSKRHSGVKFNFEQYPQIATNYMKSKYLMMSNYDLLMDKCSKLEAQEAGLSAASFFPVDTASDARSASVSGSASTSTVTTSVSSADCLVCNSILNSYETPSNATELEFETDEVRSPAVAATTATASASARTLQTASSGASIDTLKSAANCNEVVSATEQSSTPTSPPTPALRQKTYSSNNKKVASQRGSISSVAAKCAAVNEAVHLLKLPVPGIKELPQDDEPVGDGMKLRAGFIPSLFLNVTDHYVSDMVLQGTYAAPDKWHTSLREDLALAARAASLVSLPAENVAIVADMEKWDVRLISSQQQHFPYTGEQSTPVGMSQLVSSMLETVQAMNSAGISAYECLAFLESKMQEIYLQSESLAAFLLETDLCPLRVMATALNLAENDVPLLLSIASVHTPQISKKCGISFS